MACVVLKQDYEGQVNAQDILNFLKEKAPKIWVPDRVACFAEGLPLFLFHNNCPEMRTIDNTMDTNNI